MNVLRYNVNLFQKRYNVKAQKTISTTHILNLMVLLSFHGSLHLVAVNAIGLYTLKKTYVKEN
jgi:hypothetical protein